MKEELNNREFPWSISPDNGSKTIAFDITSHNAFVTGANSGSIIVIGAPGSAALGSVPRKSREGRNGLKVSSFLVGYGSASNGKEPIPLFNLRGRRMGFFETGK